MRSLFGQEGMPKDHFEVFQMDSQTMLLSTLPILFTMTSHSNKKETSTQKHWKHYGHLGHNNSKVH